MKSLLELLGIDVVERSDQVRFETRRIKKGELVMESPYEGVIGNYVWFIEPMGVLDMSKIRRSLIFDEINEEHMPLLDADKIQRFWSVVGSYRRDRLYRKGVLKYDRTVIESSPNYKTRKEHYETKQ